MKKKILKQIADLNKEKQQAVNEKDFHYAGILNIKILTLNQLLKSI